MAHRVLPGSHPFVRIYEVWGELTFADMTADDELGLNEGKPVYVMMDGSKMDVGLPSDFLNGAKQSFFVNPNLAHFALYVSSPLLRSIGQMVAKLTRRREKLTIYENREAALAYIEQLAREAETVS